jgi:hypothetical protein
MFFKKLRARSKSSSPSTKPSMISSSTQGGTGTVNANIPGLAVTAPPTQAASATSPKDGKDSEDESKDYEEFLEKARKDAERAEKRQLKAIREARERTMSPWAGRM